MMAQTRSGSTTSTQSKGGAGVYAKQIQRKFNRAQEKVLQRFGKSDETRDEQFELHVENLQAQQSDGHRIYKDLKAYLNAVKVMRDASSRLFQSLFDAYELDWEGGEDLGAIVEGEDLLWNDYDSKLRDQLFTMESYMSQFPDIRERLAKRNRKLVDYDSSRHHFESLQNAKKRDDIKIVKAEEEMKTAKKIFEDMNLELKQELPVLYSSRIGCYATVFQAISDLRDIFYKELAKNNQDLKNVMSNLRAQHPNKNFVIKNFSRSGSLKRRSLKDALSPRSLRSSFLEFHTSYSPRGSLRREHTSSFRYDRGIYESSNPELQSSHSRTKPTEVPDPEAEDADPSCTSKKSPTGEEAPSVIAARDDAEGPGRARSVAKEQSDVDDRGRETKERQRLSASHQDEEMACLGPKEDPSLEASDENALEPSENHSGKANPEASSTFDVPDDHTANPGQLTEPGPDRMENGITAGCKMDTEESGASCKRTTLNDMLDKENEEINGQL